jgi:hypothetical protein
MYSLSNPYRFRLHLPDKKETLVFTFADPAELCTWYLGVSYLMHQGPSDPQFEAWVMSS